MFHACGLKPSQTSLCQKCAKLTQCRVLGVTSGNEKLLYSKSLVAERGRFELPIPLRVCRISSAVQSTTLPPLRGGAVSAIGLIHGSAGDDKSLRCLSHGLWTSSRARRASAHAHSRHDAATPNQPADGRHRRFPKKRPAEESTQLARSPRGRIDGRRPRLAPALRLIFGVLDGLFRLTGGAPSL